MIIDRTNDCYSNLKDTKNMVQDGEKKLPLNFRINELELELKGRKDFRQAVRKTGRGFYNSSQNVVWGSSGRDPLEPFWGPLLL